MSNPNQDALQQSLGGPTAQRFEGFDFSRPQNTQRSAKDAFADLSRRAPFAPTHDKAALGGWFDQHIRPGMNALGHNVTEAGGDGFRFNNWQGDFWVDYGRGAGADGGALAWQATDAGAPSGGAQRQGQAIAPLMAGQSDLMTQILESLGGMQEQPIDPQALLQQSLR
jgi:hypothetical protein